MSCTKKILVLPMLLIALSLVGCGRKKSKIAEEEQVVTAAPAPAAPTPVPSSPANPNTPSNLPVLSFETGDILGGSTAYTTPTVTTDNKLKIAFEVGPTGNNVFDSADLRVSITVNGMTRIPIYDGAGCPEEGCQYGRTTDGCSREIDFSSVVQPGVPITITVDNAHYDWYCTILGWSAACHKKVLDPNTNPYIIGHTWSGRLLVETNSTAPLSEQCAN